MKTILGLEKEHLERMSTGELLSLYGDTRQKHGEANVMAKLDIAQKYWKAAQELGQMIVGKAEDSLHWHIANPKSRNCKHLRMHKKKQGLVMLDYCPDCELHFHKNKS